jgi:hypothetical protein
MGLKIIPIFFLLTQVFSKEFALLKTCPSCRLNTLPEVKDFIKNESQNYPIDVVYCTGDPRIVIMNDEGLEIESTFITFHKKTEIMNHLESKGFNRYR